MRGRRFFEQTETILPNPPIWLAVLIVVLLAAWFVLGFFL